MIVSVVEAIYDDYAKANFTNYELRREDLNQLAAFARQFKDIDEFLSCIAGHDAEIDVIRAGCDFVIDDDARLDFGAEANSTCG